MWWRSCRRRLAWSRDPVVAEVTRPRGREVADRAGGRRGVGNGDTVLAETAFTLQTDQSYDLKLEVKGNHLRGWIDGKAVFDVQDNDRPLEGGAVGLICEAGRIHAKTVTVKPLSS